MKAPFQDLINRTVIVTGGSSGLGEQIAYEAAKKGATVIVCSRNYDACQEVAATCTQLSGQTAYAYKVDIASPDDIEEFSAIIEAKFPKIDVLVNCAGFGLFKEFLEFDFDVVMRMFEVNVLGLMLLTQKIAIKMAEQNEGHIINIASQAGKIATAKSAVYSATKFAVIGFSNALRLELKPVNVSVTTVNPGPIDTSFFDYADASGDYYQSIAFMALQPKDLARKIVSQMGSSRREINEPKYMEIAGRFYTLFPTLGDFFASNFFNKK